jgi:hypothetical protein
MTNGNDSVRAHRVAQVIHDDPMIKTYILNKSTWKRRIDGRVTAQEKQDFVSDMSKELLECFHRVQTIVRDEARAEVMSSLLVILHRIGSTIVQSSDGIEEGYQLHPYWVPMLFAQTCISASEELDYQHDSSVHFSKMEETVRYIYEANDWPADLCINPSTDKVNSSIELPVNVDDNVFIKVKVITLPSRSNLYPLGSEWLSTKGVAYTCCGRNDNGLLVMEPHHEIYHRRSRRYRTVYAYVTEFQISRWTRVI